MSEFNYDLFVIGAGSGGVRAARMSAEYGAKVGIAEDRYLGGTCVNVGCVPKKLLVYASHFSEDFEIARSFGWSINEKYFDWKKLILNKNAEISRLNSVYQNILDKAGVDILNEHATIIDDHKVKVGKQEFTSKYILVASGGWPNIPEFPGHHHVITSNEAFFLEKLPKSIIIVGGGYIAVEFAGIFNGMGVDTSLMYRGPLFMRGFDLDLREKLADEMQKKGIKLLFNTNLNEIEKTENSYSAHLSDKQVMETGLIMYATGRNPNTDNLGLENIDIRLDDNRAITVDRNYQSSTPSVYAIGDVTNRVNLTPVALAEGMVLAKHLFNKENTYVNYENIPTCVFSQPNLGTVGLTEDEARDKYSAISIYKSSFKPMKLSLLDSEEKTFMKIITDKNTDKILGVHMLGPDAGEIIQGIAIAINAGATKSIFDSTIGIHPTAAEEFVTMRNSTID